MRRRFEILADRTRQKGMGKGTRHRASLVMIYLIKHYLGGYGTTHFCSLVCIANVSPLLGKRESGHCTTSHNITHGRGHELGVRLDILYKTDKKAYRG